MCKRSDREENFENERKNDGKSEATNSRLIVDLMTIFSKNTDTKVPVNTMTEIFKNTLQKTILTKLLIHPLTTLTESESMNTTLMMIPMKTTLDTLQPFSVMYLTTLENQRSGIPATTGFFPVMNRLES